MAVACPPRTFALDLSHVPVTFADLAALRYFDVDHAAGGEAVRYRGVYPAKGGYRVRSRAFRVRLKDVAPDGSPVPVDLKGRFPTETDAAKAAVRWLKWRHGEKWKPGDRPGKDSPRAERADVDGFDDEVRPGRPPAWVGRIWVAGTPVLVFADDRTERGFASREAARLAAVRVVEAQLGADWQRYLGRYKRPWAEAMPAGRLVVPAVVREEETAAAG